MFLVRWFYEGSEPSSACNRERIQLVDNQYAPKVLSNDKGVLKHISASSARGLFGGKRDGGGEMIGGEITCGNFLDLILSNGLGAGVLLGMIDESEAK